MRASYKYIYCLFLLCLASCEKGFLDPTNPSSITSEEVWEDPNLIEMYVNGLYNDRPGWDYNTFDNITDEARSNYPGNTPNQILVGQWDEVNNPLGFWVYDRVRRANEFMAKIDETTIDENVKKRLKGEARFLRAFLYFDMVKRYGGVPIIEVPQDLDDDLQVSRNSLDECFAFIERELDLAIDELPEDAPRGKASKGSAMALKGRVMLYYASPLYNEGNDNERWRKAAEANKALIDLNKYALYPDLTTLWLDQGAEHPESIFEVQYRLPEKYHGWDALVKPLVIANNDAGQRSPLQELVDAFPMKNGKSISDPGSNYDPNNPYVGRDDRFYAFIGYNGAKMKGTTSGPPVKEITLEIYKGGRDYDADPDTKIYNTITGYYTLKAVDPDNAIYTGGYSSVQPYIELRYAEVLLNYAEAQNEYLSSPDASVYEAVNQVRQRAGITEELTNLNKEEMREVIRNERYIEFAFEHKRYWDIRRWELATTLLDGKRYTGVFATKEPNGSFTYEYLPIDPQPNVFTERMYWMPIPQSEIAKNGNLTQNPGW
ncbi:MAG: RagB/SusD family nutrient uptake outer membrane protein [Fulvivirga sp.]